LFRLTVLWTTLTVDRALEEDHLGEGHYRGETANLSRNVVIESADPAKGRGHTMYHRGSSGSISYAEFRHLGKKGILGKYPLHFHLAGDMMRGSSVVGASFWDSGNRWITIHGTNYLVVRDCVGYQSVGPGYFLEDGTEVDNVLDRNLAVRAFTGKPLPSQNPKGFNLPGPHEIPRQLSQKEIAQIQAEMARKNVLQKVGE
jgi:hypothetical protein